MIYTRVFVHTVFPYVQVLKIAILSEKYAHDYTWYSDTIPNLICLARDYVSEEIWYRIVEVVINTQEVQRYAAKTCFEVRIKYISKLVCVCAWSNTPQLMLCN